MREIYCKQRLYLPAITLAGEDSQMTLKNCEPMCWRILKITFIIIIGKPDMKSGFLTLN